jgi:hypothetical protein
MKINFSRSALAGWLILAACFGGSGCTDTGSRASGRSEAEELKEARLQLAEYQKRFGPLPSTKPRHNLRDLQKTLPGKSLKEVRALLGKPSGVYLSGDRECWDYYGICYAPITGRTVGKVGIWFRKGLVDHLDSVF